MVFAVIEALTFPSNLCCEVILPLSCISSNLIGQHQLQWSEHASPSAFRGDSTPHRVCGTALRDLLRTNDLISAATYVGSVGSGFEDPAA